jgi:hypothetical protein
VSTCFTLAIIALLCVHCVHIRDGNAEKPERPDGVTAKAGRGIASVLEMKGRTMTLNEYRASTDSNAFWRLDSGDRQNLLDGAVERIDELEAEVGRLREALIRLRDCDGTITLPDRMDAVRKIAREALAAGEQQGEA